MPRALAIIDIDVEAYPFSTRRSRAFLWISDCRPGLRFRSSRLGCLLFYPFLVFRDRMFANYHTPSELSSKKWLMGSGDAAAPIDMSLFYTKTTADHLAAIHFHCKSTLFIPFSPITVSGNKVRQKIWLIQKISLTQRDPLTAPKTSREMSTGICPYS